MGFNAIGSLTLDGEEVGGVGHTQGTDQGLDTGGANAVTAAQTKTAYTHSQAAHAPSNAQKNSDITKAEIEAKLTGEIASHTHAGGAEDLTVKCNTQTISADYTLASGYNGSVVGPITIANTKTLTISEGSTLLVL
jgi:hypothetical protein